MARQQTTSPAPRKKSSITKKAIGATRNKKPKNASSSTKVAQWMDPMQRGIHTDAIVAGVAPTGASACVACHQKIPKGHPRWGIKYAGNPLPIPVLPLYGSHPMVMWCHGGGAGCGLAFVRYTDMASEPPAVRTCHACQDAPDEVGSELPEHSANGIRLVCGGAPKGKKIRHHVFHIACWIRSVRNTCGDAKLLVKPRDIAAVHTRKQNGLAWKDLTPNERRLVCDEFQRMGVPT